MFLFRMVLVPLPFNVKPAMEIYLRFDKEVIDDNLLDVPVDVMVEEVATDFIPNNANTMFGSTSHESNTISDDLRNDHFIHMIGPAEVAPPYSYYFECPLEA
nr:hypothetical protein CFP56_40879 [Quercus suber]